MEFEKEILQELKQLNQNIVRLTAAVQGNDPAVGANIPDLGPNLNIGPRRKSTNISRDLGADDFGQKIKEQIENARRQAEEQVARATRNIPAMIDIPQVEGEE